MTDIHPGAVLLLGLALAALALWLVRRRAKARRRAALRAAPLSAERRAYLRRAMPIYNRMPADLRARLDGLINQFLDAVKIHGADGLAVTDDMRVLIAAQACLLIVNKPDRWYDTLRTIFVYPAAFRSRVARREGALHVEREAARSGESWGRGPVVLSWHDTAFGAADDRDGANVVYHEFAHQLDQQTGVVDGAPLLDADQSATQWARVMRAAYDRMTDNLAAGRPTVLNPYGATAPGEFFAVAAEHFFEQPAALRAQEPALYDALATYFEVDPARWE